jgi:N-acetylglucosaminyl-diphospho-decaprenol L-rhamnosyltransferase
MLTVVIPSFHSSKLLEDRIAEINNKISIIIIENSQDESLKKKLENNYKNVKVIIPQKNLGWAKAVNIGIKESKTQMVLISQPDVKFIDNCVDKLNECIEDFEDFSLLTPVDLNNKSFTNYEIYNSYPKLKSKNKFLLEEADYVDLTWLINKDNFDDDDLWDEKIFLYFEAKDFSKRLKDKNKKIFIAHGINTYHIGSSSHDIKLEYYSLLNRSWHYNWSRFYYQKKHFGYFYAIKKNISVLIKLFIKLFKNIILLKKKEQKLVFTELCGLISSMLNRPSFYRPYKNVVK